MLHHFSVSPWSVALEYFQCQITVRLYIHIIDHLMFCYICLQFMLTNTSKPILHAVKPFAIRVLPKWTLEGNQCYFHNLELTCPEPESRGSGWVWQTSCSSEAVKSLVRATKFLQVFTLIFPNDKRRYSGKTGGSLALGLNVTISHSVLNS